MAKIRGRPANAPTVVLLPFGLEIAYTLIEEHLIHLHEQLLCVVDEAMDGAVPVALCIPVQGGKYDRQYHLYVIAHQRDNVLVVPVVERPFGHLKVRRGDALGQLPKQRHHHFLKFGWFDHVQNLFQLVEIHHFFRTVHFGPVFE